MSTVSTDDVITIVVPGEPKGVARARHRVGVSKQTGKAFSMTYTPAESRDEGAVIRDFAVQAMKGRLPLIEAIDLRVKIFRSIPKGMSQKQRALALATPAMVRPTKKPDWDNTSRFVDQLKGIVWLDDAQVTDAHVFKRYSDRPRLVIEVRRAC